MNLVFKQESGVFLVFGRNQSGKQFNKANTLQSNFEVDEFFVTEKHSRFFIAQKQNERMDASSFHYHKVGIGAAYTYDKSSNPIRNASYNV